MVHSSGYRHSGRGHRVTVTVRCEGVVGKCGRGSKHVIFIIGGYEASPNVQTTPATYMECVLIAPLRPSLLPLKTPPRAWSSYSLPLSMGPTPPPRSPRSLRSPNAPPTAEIDARAAVR